MDDRSTQKISRGQLEELQKMLEGGAAEIAFPVASEVLGRVDAAAGALEEEFGPLEFSDVCRIVFMKGLEHYEKKGE